MKAILKKTFARLMKDEEGVTLVEYAIALTLAVVVGAGFLTSLGDATGGKMNEATVTLDGTPYAP